jgi:hypothetical protein
VPGAGSLRRTPQAKLNHPWCKVVRTCIDHVCNVKSNLKLKTHGLFAICYLLFGSKLQVPAVKKDPLAEMGGWPPPISKENPAIYFN